MVADVAHVQREVVGDGVLDPKVVIHHVGSFEIRIHRPEAARCGGQAREPAARISTRATSGGIPVDFIESELAEIDRAAKSSPRWTRAASETGVCSAGACQVGGHVVLPAIRAILGPVHELLRKVRRVDDTGSAPDHGASFARDVIGEPQARREVFVIGLHDSIAYARLALLNHSQRGIRIEVAPEAIDLF